MNGTFQLGIYGIHDISAGKNPLLIHDHNLTLFLNGELKYYIHLERYTRNKFDAGIHDHIEKIARDLKLASKKNIELCFVDHEIGKAFISSEGKIRFEGYESRSLTPNLHKGKAYWFENEVPAYWICHEVAHLYSCIPFFGPFRENSLLIHYDGGASLSNFSAWIYREGLLKPFFYHYKLKWLTNLFNANALVFRMTGTLPKYHNSVPGKFMGLASFGSYNSKIEEWLETNAYFSHIWTSSKPFLSKLKEDWGISLQMIDNHHPFIQDVAATIHEIFIRESIKEITRLQEISKSKFLYFTGGCALSIKLNSAIRDLHIFEEIFIPPCTNDSGLSLGAAVALNLNKGVKIKRESPYIGCWQDEFPVEYAGKDLEKIAGMINKHKVIGICNGKSEAGPRALGNRSIIARADSINLAAKISEKLKERDWYRPVAPVMLAEYASYFTGLSDFPTSAKYMLYDFEIQERHIKELEGVVHIDGTSRIQILEKKKQNPFLYDLLKICAEIYGLRALINTSFNRKGEPIVQTPDQAKQSARKMNLDGLVINGKIIDF